MKIRGGAGERGGGAAGTRAASLVFLALLLAQPTSTVSYPVTIAFGRSWPFSIVVDSGRGVAYVDASSGDYPPTGYLFGIINTTSHEVAQVLPLDEIPGPMAIDQASGRVFIAGNYSVEVFDAMIQNFTGFIQVGEPILNIAFDGNSSQYLFVAAGNEVLAVDPQSGAVAHRATVSNGPYGMALDEANGMLYVSEFRKAEIGVFQASTLSLEGTIPLPQCCASKLALNPKTQMLYASTGTNLVFIVNAGTNAFESAVRVAPNPGNSTNSIAVDSSSSRVYVATSPGGSILQLNGNNGAVVGEEKVQSQVAGLAVNTRTRELYATNYHQITVFNGLRGRTLVDALVIGGVVVAVGAVAVYLFIRRREQRERARVQSGWREKPEGSSA